LKQLRRAALGYPVLYVTLGVFLIVLGNVTLNLFLASYEARMGRRGLLILYSLLMASSGAALELSKSLYVIAPALFLSGMSTTGTEAGPFQSVEVSVVPRLARRPGRALGPITCWATPPPPSAPSPVPSLPLFGRQHDRGRQGDLPSLHCGRGLAHPDVQGPEGR